LFYIWIMWINNTDINEETNKLNRVEKKLLRMKENISKISKYINDVWWKTDATDRLEKLLSRELNNQAKEQAKPLIDKIKNQVLSKIHFLLDTVSEQSEYIGELLSQINDSNSEKNQLQNDYELMISENKSLENLASTDLLTWLWNRRKLDSVINILKSNISRTNKWACFAILDIDFFKQVNTKYWIDWWDHVLKIIWDYFREFFGNDWKYQYFRIWWEEFIIISIEKYNNFNNNIQKFLNFISKKKIIFKNSWKDDLNITLSAWTMHSRDQEWKVKPEEQIRTTLSDLLTLAKENWRNRIETEK
jgi:diguanylate cyclase (GGDEF)-like protein